jgi:DNA-binding SARP family transcriptional activator
MFVKDGREAPSRFEIDVSEGWLEYRQAIELLDQSDWSRALVLLAEAETLFRTLGDQHGLWRALSGQALLHWRDGMASLAIARSMAAMRAAEATDDGFAVGCVAWQIANMLIGQGEYRRAADFLDQAQLALDAVGLAPQGGALAAVARLCGEIGRWEQMRERQSIGQREAEAAIAEIQRDLLGRLNQAATSMRDGPASLAGAARGSSLLVPAPSAMLALPEPASARAGFGTWLGRLWRKLISAADVPAVEELAGTPMAAGEVWSEAARAYVAPAPAEVEPDIEAAPAAETTADNAPSPEEAPRHGPTREPETASATHTPKITSKAVQFSSRPGLAVCCFGTFRVYYNDTQIDRWESARGRTIFKYLVARRGAAAPKEQLADMFWPESEPELARRSLHQAIYCLRQTFKRFAPDAQIIQFADDRYQICPDIPIWVDSEEFAQTIEQAQALAAAGKDDQAMRAYAVAVDLYGAPFLSEDRYEEWTEEPRRVYQAMYLEALHRLARHHYERGESPPAILLCQRALAEESCDEEAHQLLMACYVAQGLRHLAVRQYQICANVLKTELGLAPSEELEAFYRRAVAVG